MRSVPVVLEVPCYWFPTDSGTQRFGGSDGKRGQGRPREDYSGSSFCIDEGRWTRLDTDVTDPVTVVRFDPSSGAGRSMIVTLESIDTIGEGRAKRIDISPLLLTVKSLQYSCFLYYVYYVFCVMDLISPTSYKDRFE